MPSTAFTKFENKMLSDVLQLIETHDELAHGRRGRHGLGHLTRSSIFLLCAAWELYVEELALEMSKKISDAMDHPLDLSKDMAKELAQVVKSRKHELKPLEFAGDGWKGVIRSHSESLCAALNSPKADPISILFRKTTGWDAPTECWSKSTSFINEFVSLRGEIAHKGSEGSYPRVYDVKNKCFEGIKLSALETDNGAAYYLRTASPALAWRRRKITE